ncbi:MAG TPA: M1 family metallopeptidase, partial [Chitinophagales bacterium]|nr:M1 family metallopeptidase [Chitinophagales bacterium]
MPYRFLPFAALLFSLSFAASAQKPYWQQRADHVIRVTLDDRQHVLRGEETIAYTNHSPDTLRYLYIQLYPNAYSRKNTAFAKEQIRNGKLEFQKAGADKMGFIDSLAFTANNAALKHELDPVNPDYAKLFLASPLAPGQSITLHTPFRYKINKTFSRGGHEGQAYQITQWYPKPAVYDKNGWHPMPYLDNGEYYAEFGSYDVSITLPANYLIGATGTLQTEEEKTWLQKLSNYYTYPPSVIAGPANPFASDSSSTFMGTGFPPSDVKAKTIRYTADNVQDFAWFADKRFRVMKSSVALPHSGRVVDTWAFYYSERRESLWRDAVKYVDSSVYYYSKWVGDYAHPQATAVEGALLAGGGMEYPMVTVIGNMSSARSLENVIAHEVGHNWFQGMLGSNEREHPWMDEGINSYYEKRYMKATEPPKTADTATGPLAALANLNVTLEGELPYLFQARRNYEQPTCSRAPAFSQTNLGIMVYMKTPLIF